MRLRLAGLDRRRHRTVVWLFLLLLLYRPYLKAIDLLEVVMEPISDLGARLLVGLAEGVELLVVEIIFVVATAPVVFVVVIGIRVVPVLVGVGVIFSVIFWGASFPQYVVRITDREIRNGCRIWRSWRRYGTGS